MGDERADAGNRQTQPPSRLGQGECGSQLRGTPSPASTSSCESSTRPFVTQGTDARSAARRVEGFHKIARRSSLHSTPGPRPPGHRGVSQGDDRRCEPLTDHAELAGREGFGTRMITGRDRHRTADVAPRASRAADDNGHVPTRRSADSRSPRVATMRATTTGQAAHVTSPQLVHPRCAAPRGRAAGALPDDDGACLADPPTPTRVTSPAEVTREIGRQRDAPVVTRPVEAFVRGGPLLRSARR